MINDENFEDRPPCLLPDDISRRVIHDNDTNKPVYFSPFLHSSDRIRLRHPIAGPYHTGQRVAVSYYQWTPLILAIAAFLFHVPYIVWHIMAVSSGMPLESMLSAAREVSKVQKDGGSRDGFINDILFR